MTWICSLCDNENEDNAQECNICTNPKDPSSPVPQSPAASPKSSPPKTMQASIQNPSPRSGAIEHWFCSFCENENEATNAACTLCMATHEDSNAQHLKAENKRRAELEAEAKRKAEFDAEAKRKA
eukprot:PhF_6_TR34582/c0_g1_i4/m.50367